MPEPLSIAVAVTGLLKATYSASTTLGAFCTGVSNAPKAVQDALNETRAVTNVLRQLESYLDSTTVALPSRSSLLTLEEVVTTLTDCVCALSELESILNGLKTRSMGALDRLKWLWHNDEVNRITQRIERHKTSLTLMLSILTCKSQHDAAEASARLVTVVEELLAENPDLMNRLQSSDYANSTARSLDNLTLDDTSTITTTGERSVIRGDELTFPLPRENDTGFLSDGVKSISFTIDIEISLQASWVYRRAQQHHIRSSLIQDGQSFGLSLLSEISLSEISNISVLSLPISVDEITNGHHYATPLPLGALHVPTGIDSPEFDLHEVYAGTTSRPLAKDLRPAISAHLCAACDEQLEYRFTGETVVPWKCGHQMHKACFYGQLLLESLTCPECHADLDVPDHSNLDSAEAIDWRVFREEGLVTSAGAHGSPSSREPDVSPIIPSQTKPAVRPQIGSPGSTTLGAPEPPLSLPSTPDPLHNASKGKTIHKKRSPKAKSLLTAALDQANTAVLLDCEQDLDGAIIAYRGASQKLWQAMRLMDSEDKVKITTIRREYVVRYKVLEDLKNESTSEKDPDAAVEPMKQAEEELCLCSTEPWD